MNSEGLTLSVLRGWSAESPQKAPVTGFNGHVDSLVGEKGRGKAAVVCPFGEACGILEILVCCGVWGIVVCTSGTQP